MTNRRQYVKYKTCELNLKSTNTCIPQESTLDLLLFSIYINDLVTVSDKFNYIKCADDATIHFKTEDFPMIIYAIVQLMNYLKEIYGCKLINWH